MNPPWFTREAAPCPYHCDRRHATAALLSDSGETGQFVFFFLWRELRCDLYFIPSPSFLPRLAGPFNVSPVCSTFLSVTFLEPPDKQAYCQSCGSFYGQMRCLQTFSFSLFPSSKRRVCTKKKVTVRIQNYLPVKNYSSAILSVSLFNGNKHTWGKEEKLLLLKI